MSKVATILGLAAAAAASASAPPAYGASSAAPAYSAPPPAYSSAAAGYSSSSSAAAGYSASSGSAPSYGASSSGSAYPVSSSMSTSYGYPSSASSYYPSSSSAAPTSPPFPSCWSECFQENDISSESAVCGNEAVSSCIHSTCDCADTWSYFSWYNSYCEAPTTSTSTSSSAYGYATSSSASSSSAAYGYSVSSATSSAASETPSSPIDQCWSSCFASNGVTSEESLCGNSAVSACIHDTCSAAEDQAYWSWYNGYCVATSTGTTTVTTVCTPLSTPYSPVTTTYVSTETYGWAPVTTGATTLPSLPSSPAAPWTGWTAPATSAATAGPTATGYSPPAQSTWAPVPATGAGAMTKPGVFFAAAMALVALF